VADSRWWKDFDAVIATALPAGSRVLDVGCGDGGLVDRLVELGFDALGVDPAAPAHPRLIGESVEQELSLGAFDAVTAVMALHHAELDAVGMCTRVDVYKHAGYFHPDQADELKALAHRSTVTDPPAMLREFAERYARTEAAASVTR